MENEIKQEITAGEVIRIEADTRAGAAEKLRDLRRQASEQGLVAKEGGFIHHSGVFIAEIAFIKKQ